MTRLHPSHRKKHLKAANATGNSPKKSKSIKRGRVRVSMATFDSLASLPTQPLKKEQSGYSRQRKTMDSLVELVPGQQPKNKASQKQSRRKIMVDCSPPMTLATVAMVAPKRVAGQKMSIARKKIQLPLSKRTKKKKYPIVRGRQNRKEKTENFKLRVLPDKSHGNEPEKEPQDCLDPESRSHETDSSVGKDNDARLQVGMPAKASMDGQWTSDDELVHRVVLHFDDKLALDVVPELQQDTEAEQADAGSEEKRMDQSHDFYSEIGESLPLGDEAIQEDETDITKTTEASDSITSPSDKQAVTCEHWNNSVDTEANKRQESAGIKPCVKSPVVVGKKMVTLESLDERAVYLCLSSGKYYRLVELDGEGHGS